MADNISELEGEIESLKNKRKRAENDGDEETVKQLTSQISEKETELEEMKRRTSKGFDSSAMPSNAGKDDYKSMQDEEDEKEENKDDKDDDDDDEEEKDDDDEEEKDDDEDDKDEDKNDEKENKDDKDKNTNKEDKDKKTNKENKDDRDKNTNKENKDNEYDAESARKRNSENNSSEGDTTNQASSRSKELQKKEQERQLEKQEAEQLQKKATEDLAKEAAENATSNAAKNAAKDVATKEAASSAVAAGATAVSVPILPIILAILIAILIIIFIIGGLAFMVSLPGLTNGKIKKEFQKILDSIEGFFIGNDEAQVSEADIINVAQYLENMGYELKSNGFLTPNGEEIKKDENGNIESIDSKYIWAYLVADNGTYMVKQLNTTWRDALKKFANLNPLINIIDHLAGTNNDSYGAGMISIDGYDKNLFESINIDKENKKMTIDMISLSGKDTIVYNIDGWSGRYGKPLEFLLSLHLATMAPDLTYELATGNEFDTTVHVKLLKVKLKIKTTIQYNGVTWSLDDLKSLNRNGDPATMLPPKYDEYGNEYWTSTIGDVIDSMEKANDKALWTYIPYISWVEKHWFRDVYFDVNAKDIKSYANNVNGEKTNEIEIVEKELMDDGEYWDSYASIDEDGYSENLNTKTIKGVHVYKTVKGANYKDYGDYETWKDAVLAETLFSNPEYKSVVDVEITGTKLLQIADAERGVTNLAIKKLFVGDDAIKGTDDDPKYYIYDGTEWTADEISKVYDDENYEGDLKKPISITRDSLAAFTILENTHTLDADYIYKDLKELLVELKYFKQDEMIGDNLKVLKWVIPNYKDKDSGYVSWPDREVDKDPYEYGTLITSESNYPTDSNASLNNTKLASLEFAEGVTTIMIADETTDSITTNATKEKNTGYKSGMNVVAPASGEISYDKDMVKIKIDDSANSDDNKYSTKNGDNICNGYTLCISGFSASKTSGTVKAGDKIGTTTSDNIKLIMLDESNAIVENIEDYIILPGEEKEPFERKSDPEAGSDLSQYDNNDKNGENGGNGGNGENNNDNGGNSGGNSGDNSGNNTYGGEISASANGYRTKEDIIYAVTNAGWPQSQITNVEAMMSGLLKLQSDFDIDPLVAISLFRGESSVGVAYQDRGEYRLDNHQHWSNSRGFCHATSHEPTHKFACYDNYSDNAYDWGNYVHNRFSSPIRTWSGLASTEGMTIYQNCNVDDGSHAISFYKKLVEVLKNKK